MTFRYFYLFFILISINLLSGCNGSENNLIPNSETQSTPNQTETREQSQEFKDYWYQGEAEITSYKLSQERYGELREGSMVAIFVTEDFNPEKQVKANTPSESTHPILKSNLVKKFLTGIYPYSIMTSTFSPVTTQDHAMKVSLSVQEWCGQVYMQLNNRDVYHIESHSYFEKEADRDVRLEKTWLEDEIWNLVRINPESLPTGELLMIPSFESIRLRHREIEAIPAIASLRQGDSISTYQVKYPGIMREIALYFNSKFPFEIEKWEVINGGSIDDTTKLKTTAIRDRRIKTAYWKQHGNSDLIYRDSLGLSK